MFVFEFGFDNTLGHDRDAGFVVCVCVVWGVVWSVPFLGNMYVPPSMSRFLFKAHSLHIGIEPRKRESFKHRFPLHYLFCVFVVSWFLGM